MRSPNLGDCFALPSLREFSKHIVRTFMMQHYGEAYMIRNYCCLFLPYVRKSSWKWPSVLHQAFQTRGQPRQVYSLTVTLPRDTTQRSHFQISNLGKQCETKKFPITVGKHLSWKNLQHKNRESPALYSNLLPLYSIVLLPPNPIHPTWYLCL